MLIQAVRSGELDLAPGADAGWYDYQLYALETLLLPERGPESQNLLLTAGYKKKLIETFKSILTQTRETHVKQLDFGARGASGEAAAAGRHLSAAARGAVSDLHPPDGARLPVPAHVPPGGDGPGVPHRNPARRRVRGPGQASRSPASSISA